MTDDFVYDTIRAGLLRARSHLPFSAAGEFDYNAATEAILAALAGRLVPPGMVAVPVDDLRRAVFLARGGYGDELSIAAMSAIERLEGIVNGR